MRTTLVLATLLLVLAGTAGTAAAAPAWCKDADPTMREAGLEDIFTKEDPRDAIYSLIAALCFPDGAQRAAAGKLEATRQAWSRRLAMTEADWSDAANWTTHHQGARNSPSMYRPQERLAWSTWGAVDQYGGILNATIGMADRTIDPHYLADAFGPKLTEAGRLGYLTNCLRDSATPVEWAMCQADVDAFDVKKLSSELRSDPHADGYQKMVVRIEAYQFGSRLAKHGGAVKALIAKDPAYGEMFKLAAAAKKTMAGADPSLLALVADMDEARTSGSRRAAAGCEARTWAAWSRVVGAIPAKAFAALIGGEDDNPYLVKVAARLVGEPNGYLASLALFTCHGFGADPDYLIRTLGVAMGRWPGFRGPRTAAHTAIVAANLQLDRRDARIEYPALNRGWIGGSGSSGGGGRGEIAKLTTAGDKTTIELAKVKGKQRVCAKGRYTNRVTMIRTDGVVVYEYVCEAYRTETYSEPPAPPQVVNARYATALKKGMAVQVVEDVVTVAYPKSGAELPSVVAGVPVK